jgi:bisphosphoglycerate-dependent phosphoglycerate mutase
MTTIILTRHGHVEGIHPPRFRGRQEVPLSEQGIAEANMTAARIASSWRPAAIYTTADLIDLTATGNGKPMSRSRSAGPTFSNSGFPFRTLFAFRMASRCKTLSCEPQTRCEK